MIIFKIHKLYELSQYLRFYQNENYLKHISFNMEDKRYYLDGCHDELNHIGQAYDKQLVNLSLY